MRETEARAEHKCAGCAGTGWVPVRFEGQRYFCTVCLGSGRISDRMPAADALADAETLMRLKMWDWDELSDCLYSAQMCGRQTYWSIGSWINHSDDVEQSARLATLAARYAFRAVPGLRG